jgi:hypothetical protein
MKKVKETVIEKVESVKQKGIGKKAVIAGVGIATACLVSLGLIAKKRRATENDSNLDQTESEE